MNQQQTLATLMASSIHEMKNDFGTLLLKVEKLVEGLDLEARRQIEVAQLRYEAASITTELTRILTTYKSNVDGYEPYIDQHSLSETLEDVCLKHRLTKKAYGVTITFKCDPDILCFFDTQLITNVIDTAIYNAVKASAKTIILEGESGSKYTTIHIKDEGEGFPLDILKKQGHKSIQSLDTNNTGLGLYFAHQICKMHRNEDHYGFVKLQNNHDQAGACVSLYIPN